MGGESGECEIDVGINGPFGAPAQRFYDFNHSVIIGAGIGVTQFSGILADLQYKDDLDHGGPGHNRQGHRCDSDATAAASDYTHNTDNRTEIGDKQRSDDAEKRLKEVKDSRNGSNNVNGQRQPSKFDAVGPDLISEQRKPQADDSHTFAENYRRVDFHWMVRDRNYLQWLSDLLNEVSLSQEWHRKHEEHPCLDIRINTHVTAKKKEISTHVYRWLLEMHRTEEHPASPLTGLLNPTQFGRPEFDLVLDEHYEEMLKFRANKRRSTKKTADTEIESSRDDDEELKVGVFYCGAPVVGEILADKCRELTTRGRHDGSKIEHHFMIEVFG